MGAVKTPIGTASIQTNDYARALVVQPDGKLVAAGESDFGLALVRYNADGTLDDTLVLAARC